MVKNLLPQHVVPNGKYELIVYLRVSLGSGQSPSWFDDFKIVHKPACGPDSIYTADVKSYSDYYAFGMQMPGRYANDGYRYSFDGKERDSEGMGGGGSTYDYCFRIYNPQLGRFLSVDSLFRSFPWNSTFAYAEGSPIANIDLDGLEKKEQISYDDIHYERTKIEMDNTKTVILPVDPNYKPAPVPKSALWQSGERVDAWMVGNESAKINTSNSYEVQW